VHLCAVYFCLWKIQGHLPILWGFDAVGWATGSHVKIAPTTYPKSLLLLYWSRFGKSAVKQKPSVFVCVCVKCRDRGKQTVDPSTAVAVNPQDVDRAVIVAQVCIHRLSCASSKG